MCFVLALVSKFFPPQICQREAYKYTVYTTIFSPKDSKLRNEGGLCAASVSALQLYPLVHHLRLRLLLLLPRHLRLPLLLLLVVLPRRRRADLMPTRLCCTCGCAGGCCPMQLLAAVGVAAPAAVALAAALLVQYGKCGAILCCSMRMCILILMNETGQFPKWGAPVLPPWYKHFQRF